MKKKTLWEKEKLLVLLFPQCFQKTSTADTSKPGLVWGRVKAFEDHKRNAD